MKKLLLWLSATVFASAFFSAASFAQTVSVPASQGIFEISSALDDGYVLDVKTCTWQDEPVGGTQLQMYRPQDVNQQKFYLEQAAANKFRIAAVHSGLALTARPDEAQEDGKIPVILSALPDSETDQIWRFVETTDGFYYIRSEEGGYLTLDDSRMYSGLGLSLRDYTGRKNQKWILKKTQISQTACADTDLVNPYGPDGPYHNVCLAVYFGSEKETLTGEEIASWITETPEHQLSSPEEGFLSYARKLADAHNTQGHERRFRTSYGKVITLYKGDFGWALDVEKTADALMEASQCHYYKAVLPVWSHKGVGFTAGDDIGNSYVEVSLENQKVWLYKDGVQLLETDCVSGTYGTDRQTPGGVYSIFYMQSPDVLNGSGYSSYVEYWMAFNGNIGLHDASWRSEFGGDIFRSNGSHGCINLPTDAAKLIYETISIGYPVVCYN